MREAHLVGRGGGRALNPSVDSPGELPCAQELCANTPLLGRLDKGLQSALVVVLHGVVLRGPGRVARGGREVVVAVDVPVVVEEEEEVADDVDDAGDAQSVGIFINGARASSQPADETDGLGESFGGMSISPARPEQLQQLLVV